MTKKELVKLVTEQQEKLTALIGAVRQSQDGEKGGTSQIQALQSNLEALSTLPNIMKNADTKGDAKEMIKLVQLNKYRIPHEFTTEYGFRLNKGGDWGANSCELELAKINSSDPVLQRFYYLTALKYAKLFNSALLYKDGEFGKPGVGTDLDLDKRIVKFTTNITSTAISIKQSSLNFEGKQVERSLDEVIILKNNDLNIGDYVLMIPGIGKEIFFERQLQKNVSFLNIIPSAPNANENQRGQLAPFLSDSETGFADETIDRQVGVNVENIKGSKLKGVTPPPEIKETFEVLQNNLKFHREDFHQRFGVPVECSFNNKQHLNSDANMVVTNVEYTAKAGYITYEDMMLQLIAAGAYDSTLEEIESMVDEKFDEMKEESKDESAKEEHKTNDVGENKEEVK